MKQVVGIGLILGAAAFAWLMAVPSKSGAG
jgi:hypothetical protein